MKGIIRLKKLVDVLTSKIRIIPFKTENHTEAFTLFGGIK